MRYTDDTAAAESDTSSHQLVRHGSRPIAPAEPRGRRPPVPMLGALPGRSCRNVGIATPDPPQYPHVVDPAVPVRPERRSRDRANCTSAMRSPRSEEHTSELQSLIRITYAVICLTTKNLMRHNTITD